MWKEWRKINSQKYFTDILYEEKARKRKTCKNVESEPGTD
jgi:hypothetical protein